MCSRYGLGANYGPYLGFIVASDFGLCVRCNSQVCSNYFIDPSFLIFKAQSLNKAHILELDISIFYGNFYFFL